MANGCLAAAWGIGNSFTAARLATESVERNSGLFASTIIFLTWGRPLACSKKLDE